MISLDREFEPKLIPNRFRFESEGRVNRESMKRALNWLRDWLENEWIFFSLSKILKCGNGVTIQPLSFVSADNVGVEIYPEKRFDLYFEGDPVSLGLLGGVAGHEVIHLNQIPALLNYYLFNESVIFTVADILKNPKDYDFKKVRRSIGELKEIRVDNSKISFLEADPTFGMLKALCIANVEQRLYDEVIAEQISSSVMKSLSKVHSLGLNRFVKIRRDSKIIYKIFLILSHIYLSDLDGAEREARRLHDSGCTYEDVPKIFIYPKK